MMPVLKSFPARHGAGRLEADPGLVERAKVASAGGQATGGSDPGG